MVYSPARSLLVRDAYGLFPMIALAVSAVVIPNGKFTGSK
jgi:hypothetical protein